MTAGAFVDAGKLQPGDEVTGPAGEPQTLAATRRSEHPDGIAVYNFRVAGYHTYYAAAPGGRPVLVHNANCGTGRAPEFDAGVLSEDQFLRGALEYLGPGYREVSPGRYLSKDEMRQVRYGNHETRSLRHHGHFEVYDIPASLGGRVIVNWVVDLVPGTVSP